MALAQRRVGRGEGDGTTEQLGGSKRVPGSRAAAGGLAEQLHRDGIGEHDIERGRRLDMSALAGVRAREGQAVRSELRIALYPDANGFRRGLEVRARRAKQCAERLVAGILAPETREQRLCLTRPVAPREGAS